MTNPQFVIVQILPAAQDGLLKLLIGLKGDIQADEGEVLALTKGEDVDPLEPGSVPYLTPHFPSSVDIQCGEKAILL